MVLIFCKPQYMNPYERTFVERKWPTGKFTDLVPYCVSVGTIHIQQLNGNRNLGRDNLDRYAITNRESRAQGLVSIDQNIHGALEAFEIQCPAEPDRQFHVVYSARTLELIEKPKTLLSERDRE